MDESREQWQWQEPGRAWKGIGIYHITLVVTSREPLLGTLVVSNNNPERVTPFAEQLGLPFVPNGWKPLPVGYIKAREIMGIPKRDIAAVGDQIFTDVMGCHLMGIRSIFVFPIEPETSLPFRFKRARERYFLPKRPGKNAG